MPVPITLTTGSSSTEPADIVVLSNRGRGNGEVEASRRAQRGSVGRDVIPRHLEENKLLLDASNTKATRHLC